MEKIDTYRKWCCADTLLLFTAVVFCLSLGLEIIFPKNAMFEGLHFIADAALVGAVADYFAVTAIFRHPFKGLIKIKGVTGLLPSQRAKFSEGAVTLLKEELVSTKVLLRAIRKTNLVDKLTGFIRNEKRQQEVVYALLDLIRDKLQESSQGRNISELAAVLRATLKENSPRQLIKGGLAWLKEDGNGATFFGTLSPPLENYLRQPKFRQMLEDGYESLTKPTSESKGFLSNFLEWGLDKLKDNDTINTKELAKKTQQQLAQMANEIGRQDSPLQKNITEIVIQHGETLLNDRGFCHSVGEFRKKLLDDAPIEESLQEVFSYLWRKFDHNEIRQSIEHRAVNALRSNIAEILREQLVLVIALLGRDEELRKSLEKFMREIATLSSMEGRDMASDIIKKKLDEKDDEDINRLVWNKFDDDLIFIRINGTIVGALAGAILFGLTIILKLAI